MTWSSVTAANRGAPESGSSGSRRRHGKTHVHHAVHRGQGGSDDRNNLEYIHAVCHQRHHAGGNRQPRRLERQP
ncbi:HNH endonuclease [Streptomyces sp. NPDC004237]|uniref:HNH endonuclease n=1 Tax=Streptomyces sp. NPDC004237 TaxID=3154455 RepID=UPI0033AF2D6E